MLPVFEYKVAYNYHPIAETFSHIFFGQSLVHRKKNSERTCYSCIYMISSTFGLRLQDLCKCFLYLKTRLLSSRIQLIKHKSSGYLFIKTNRSSKQKDSTSQSLLAILLLLRAIYLFNIYVCIYSGYVERFLLSLKELFSRGSCIEPGEVDAWEGILIVICSQ